MIESDDKATTVSRKKGLVDHMLACHSSASLLVRGGIIYLAATYSLSLSLSHSSHHICREDTLVDEAMEVAESGTLALHHIHKARASSTLLQSLGKGHIRCCLSEDQPRIERRRSGALDASAHLQEHILGVGRKHHPIILLMWVLLVTTTPSAQHLDFLACAHITHRQLKGKESVAVMVVCISYQPVMEISVMPVITLSSVLLW